MAAVRTVKIAWYNRPITWGIGLAFVAMLMLVGAMNAISVPAQEVSQNEVLQEVSMPVPQRIEPPVPVAVEAGILILGDNNLVVNNGDPSRILEGWLRRK